jgi:cobalamin biosynthesis protein CbiD
MEKVLFTDPETQETVEFQVEDETQMNGMKYLLVSEDSGDDEDDTFNAYILKEIKDDNGEVTYQVVEDEVEFLALAGVFKLLSDEETDIVF